MTFVGKIFIVLQLVLSICFMAWAGAVYTAETNWKEQAENVTTQKAAVEADLAESRAALEAQKTAAATEIKTLQEQVASLDGKLTVSTDQLAKAEKGLEEARTAVDQQAALAKIAKEQADFRKEETLRLRDTNQRLQSQINDLLAKVRTLEDTVFEKDTLIAGMQVRHNQALENVATYRRILLSLGSSLDPADYPDLEMVSEPPPSVVGRVLDTQVSSATGTEFVEVSLGSDDGFGKGDVLVVYRGDEYLGKIKLTSVEVDRSVGHLIPASRPRNGAIQKGDNVRPQASF